MGSIPPDRFARALSSLDGPAFAALVADWYELRGWAVTRDGQVVEATRDGVSRRELVVPSRRVPRLHSAPSTAQSVDAVVTARRAPTTGDLPRGTPECEVTDADAMRERLLYGLSSGDCALLFETHLDVPARSQRWDGDPAAAVGSHERADALIAPIRRTSRILRGGSIDRSAIRTPAVLGVVLLAIGVVALAGANGGLLGGPAPFDDGTVNGGGEGSIQSTPSSGEGGDHGPIVDAEGTDAADGDGEETDAEDGEETDAGDGEADAGTSDHSVYDVDPTCERSPREVAQTVSAAFEGDEQTHALHVYWQFTTPTNREQIRSYRAFVTIMRTSLEDLLYAEQIVSGEASVENGTAVVPIEVTTEYGAQQSWEYQLVQWEHAPYEGCWMIDRLAPS